MPEQSDRQEQTTTTPHQPTELVEVLRRRLDGLKQAYQQLEQYVRSLEGEQQKLKGQLDEARHELRQWHSSRGVRLSRTLGLLGHGLQQNLAITSGLVAQTFKHSLKATLDLPEVGATLKGELSVSGWTTGDATPNLQVEVWLRGVRLGLADNNLPRWDVINQQPWQNRLECGFAGRFELDPLRFKPGPATLRIDFRAGQTSKYEISCPVIIGQAEPYIRQKLYQDWIKRTGMTGWDFLAQRATSQGWDYQPLISLLVQPPTAARIDHLSTMLDSALAQTYRHLEILLQLPPNPTQELQSLAETYTRHNGRVRLNRSHNLNDLLEASQGDYIAIPAADSLLSEDALFKAVRYLNRHRDATLLYSDEDYLDETGQRAQPQFKPDWSPELFYSRPYTGQLTFFQAAAVHLAGGFQTETGEAQAYDLTLRLSLTGAFYHLPDVIYHSRQPLNLGQPLSQPYQQALQTHFDRTMQPVTVESGSFPASLRSRYHLTDQPTVSLIIPTRDQSEVLRRCLDSIFERTSYPNYEVIVVDNASHQPETQNYFAELAGSPRVRLLSFPGPFNYAAINNFAATEVESDLLVFLNNDTEVISPNWLQELAAYAARPDIGAAGARLLYPDDTIQHAGVVVGLLGVADHVMKGLAADDPGYLGLAKSVKNVSAVTAACMMTRRELFCQLGGFNAENLAVAFNDVDYCLKLRERGLRLVWTPYAELYHYESLSRGLDSSIEKESRLHQEITYMFGRWPGPISRDPYYNPNLSHDKLDYTVIERFPQT